MPVAHPLADRPVLELAELAGQPWIDNDSQAGSCRRNIETACAAAGFVPRYPVQTQDHLTAIAFAAAGVGITVVPNLCTVNLPESVVAVPLANPTPMRSISAVVNSSASERDPTGLALATLRRCADATRHRQLGVGRADFAATTSAS
jgi:DNA-binding transcriptional LysR family regulator